ncbi:putative TetR family regulatory protein [Tsukamurella pulmonis]|uniref:TetR/AcrR family transcriptional regulator n=1 Tax=Tsukamurella pulmonis TaxID=47312 RepID=UPI001EDF050E|nr:TetR family transcriptional regulator [Tsukamurella pulmonis]BDD80643.1 putative TetR family regulatory protein [Tsukamurella pulmonis]
MPPDSSDTKRRILAAAHTEFAANGLAGARVDRIAESAGANKRSIYVHFGPKEELFDLVVGRALQDMADAVPLTPDDLPAYAGALFDYLSAHPDVLRLTTWSRLERPGAAPSEQDAYAPKIDALRTLYGTAAADLLALVLGLITAWQNASPALRALADDEAATRLGDHREALVAAVRATVDAATTQR